jgi:hypothetical protein
MQLSVEIDDNGREVIDGSWVVRTFQDQDKISSAIARALRRWLRCVPMTAGGSRLDLRVTALWQERQEPSAPPRPVPARAAARPRKSKKARK